MIRENYTQRIRSAQRIVIKVGSARVSGDESRINDFLFSLASDIRQLKDEGKQVILVSSGAIAQGKKVLASSTTVNLTEGKVILPERQALAAIGQSRLMKLYENIFSLVNTNIAQILFGAPQIKDKDSLDNLQNTFHQLLSWGVLPIVNENDSIATEELKLGDNDLLSALVSLIIGADILIILTGVDGFLRDDKRIPFLSEVTDSDLEHAKGPEGPGTGGMNTKLKAAGILSRHGITTAIVNGKEKNCISKLILENQIGTLIGTKGHRYILKPDSIRKIIKTEFTISDGE